MIVTLRTPIGVMPSQRNGNVGIATPSNVSEYASDVFSGAKMFASYGFIPCESACCTQSIVHAWNSVSIRSRAFVLRCRTSGHVKAIAAASEPTATAMPSRSVLRRVEAGANAVSVTSGEDRARAPR